MAANGVMARGALIFELALLLIKEKSETAIDYFGSPSKGLDESSSIGISCHF